MADVGTSSRVRESIPPPKQPRQPPGRRERERPVPPRHEGGPRARGDDERECHIDEYA